MIARVFPETFHDRITYPFAVIRAGDKPEARALMVYLASPEGRTIFVRRGFIPN
jgi:ABC-type molybdate transport system substrate-binding protein